MLLAPLLALSYLRLRAVRAASADRERLVLDTYRNYAASSHFQNYWRHEIRIVSLDSGEQQHREVNGYPLDWSKDGRWILYIEVFGKPRPTFFLLPASGGVPRVATRPTSRPA